MVFSPLAKFIGEMNMLDRNEIEIALDRLDEVFASKDNQTGLDIVESARITLTHKGELSDSQMRWLERNIKIHKIDIEEQPQIDAAVISAELEELHGEVCRVQAKLERLMRELGF